MKKLILSFWVLGIIGLSGCTLFTSDYERYWVLEKSRYGEGNSGPTNLYEKAQEDPTMVHYSSERISEGKMMIFLAFGEKYKNDKITVKEVRDEKDKSVIVLHVEKDKGTDKNPVMYIGVNKLRDSVDIVNENGKKIFEIKQNEGVTSQQ
ncbi:hypothetical protein CN680_01995 [Bacillus pseudomycoides]|uniref:hypothetical protein n=1 Tax=Bacillus pseudomycoides TaxID=64104 RepID=UPI000BECA078|nr:hypothetical protein [Bacillus pseudomycoides]PED70912.1 hypothetical protein CON97_16745 [Bacillus pseudomycoides]PEI39524.1 hypothetical protein CN620_18985 [Bacillus pseudomycoides]PEJ81632.1 hypothetical protein CN680_01995 [Bacillus pseudomycoides]PEM13736.1 hypothetical protein CN628_18825 [Bacillus pseudomycoides]PEO91497.1 hypothetical protein CN550_27220 [Bacillus pseudomycoides]